MIIAANVLVLAALFVFPDYKDIEGRATNQIFFDSRFVR